MKGVIYSHIEKREFIFHPSPPVPAGGFFVYKHFPLLAAVIGTWYSHVSQCSSQTAAFSLGQ
jgi:hypothetical protein